MTRFPDGTFLEAHSTYDEASTKLARELGYRGPQAIARMNQEHDLLHTMLAVLNGRPHSPTLWSAAHGGRYADPNEAASEEALVLRVAAAIHGGSWKPE